MSRRIAVFHPGTQHSWQTSLALQQLGLLEFYATSIFYQPDRWPYRVERYLPGRLAKRAHAEFGRFSHPTLDPALVRTAGVAEWLERIAKRSGARTLARRIDAFGNRQFAAGLRSEIQSTKSFGLWGYSGSSRDAFKAAEGYGRLRILDRTIGDWRVYNELMDAVHQDYGEFFLPSGYRIGQAQIDRDDEEYSLADVILAGSPFAADTVRRSAADTAARERVRVLNYCYDEFLFSSLPPPRLTPRDAPVRFVFLGQAGPRKGIHLVLKVFDRIPKSAATLTIVGDLQVPPAVFARYANRVSYQATVARRDVPAFLSAADVLLFPSYFEGSALSLLEGLASGVALIQSTHAGVGVTPETGLMLPDLSEESLHAAIMTAIEDRTRLASWRMAAQAEAKRYAFDGYRERIAALLAGLEGASNLPSTA